MAAVSVFVAATVAQEPSRQSTADRDQVNDGGGISIEIIASGLDSPTDFAVAEDSKTVFVAEPSKRRVIGFNLTGQGSLFDQQRVEKEVDAEHSGTDARTVIIEGIEEDGQPPNSICLHAVGRRRLLVGVQGFDSPDVALTLFDILSAETPLHFPDQQVPVQRSFQSSLQRFNRLDVLKIIEQHRGITLVGRMNEGPISMCDLQFKGGSLKRFADPYDQTMSEPLELPTVAVETLGGYLVAAESENEGRQSISFLQGNGAAIESFQTDLDEIVSIAFSPTAHHLMVLGRRQRIAPTGRPADDEARIPDSADQERAKEPAQKHSVGQAVWGVYQIVTSNGECQSRLIHPVHHPIALKFDATGDAWVLSQSGQDNQSDESGMLIKITGLDRRP
jgi:hypothetical protein